MPKIVQCLNPKYIQNPYTLEKMYVPCGKCESCLQNRSQKWVKRLELEAQNWKYVYFITLTYKPEYRPSINVYSLFDSCPDDEKLKHAIEQCYPLIEYYNGELPCFSVRDCQLFFKRLRKKIYENEKVPEHRFLRYYLSCEYGETLLAPHYHAVLFTNSEWLSSCYSKVVSESWSHYDLSAKQYRSIGRTDAQRVLSTACQYVAQYVNFSSHLPEIYQTKYFRPFSLFSRRPPIGTSKISRAQVEKIFFNGLPRMSIKSPDNNEVISVRLWRCLENNLFPKCKKFDEIDTFSRIKLYGVFADSEFCGDFHKLVSQITFGLDKYLVDPSFKISDTLTVISDVFVEKTGQVFEINLNSLKRLWYQSQNVIRNCNYFNISLYEHIELIEKYYHNCALDNLRKQFESEEEYLTSFPQNPLSELPYLLDCGFIGNVYAMSVDDYNQYLEQFGVDSPLMNPYDSRYFDEIAYRFKKVYSDSKKTRCKNEYLDSHSNLQNLRNIIDTCLFSPISCPKRM